MSDLPVLTELSVADLSPAKPSTGLIQPAATVGEIAQAFRAYQELRSQILTADDFQEIPQGRFLKRSGWRKLSTAFAVNFTLLEKHIERDDQGKAIYAEFIVRAMAPNGRYADGWGSCSIDEDRWNRQSSRNKQDHDLPATAYTRATNRACADLFGMGEMSAEEMVNGGNGEQATVKSRDVLSTQPGSMTVEQRRRLLQLFELHKVPFELRQAIQRAAYHADTLENLSAVHADDWVGALEDDARREKMFSVGETLLGVQKQKASVPDDPAATDSEKGDEEEEDDDLLANM